ncbi:hypothetical protein DFH06DRAFT_1374119 [Mycena polygramma]|nr:hypothetical protein DFH06DRAFT_1374119 [Mycena polygramma]
MNDPAGTQQRGKGELFVSAAELRRELHENINIKALAQQLGKSPEEMENVFLNNTKDRIVVEFTRGTLELKSEEKEKLREQGRAILEPYKAHRKLVGDVIWAQNDRGCRILVDNALIPAIIEAQRRQRSAPIRFTSSKGTHKSTRDERLLLVQDYELPAGRGGETLPGYIDYMVLLVPKDSYRLIRAGSNPLLRNESCLLAVVVLKSPLDWDEARARLAAQCIATMKNTDREFFPAVLTSGIVWVFCVAVAHEAGVTIYDHEAMGWTLDDEFDAQIVATLVELMRSHRALSSIFELGRG